MRILEIPRDAWIEQLNAFTIAHEGWLASLDVFGRETGAQAEIRNLPLLGVSADRVDHDGTIAVSVARSAVEHFTHIVRRVAHIYVEQPDNGSTAALLVESIDGTGTILHLCAPTSRSGDLLSSDPPVSNHITC